MHVQPISEDVSELRISELRRQPSAASQAGRGQLSIQHLKLSELCLTMGLPEDQHATAIRKPRLLTSLAADARGHVADLLHCPVDLRPYARPGYVLLPSSHRAGRSSAAPQATDEGRCR